jgi:hypothetical protein
MVSGHYREIFPTPQQWEQWPPPNYIDYQELLRKAKLYDEITKQKDCPDPEKVKWQKDLEKFMRDKYGLSPK